jgi:hypothetical protein
MIVIFGNAIKGVGVVLAVLIVLGEIFLTSQAGRGSASTLFSPSPDNGVTVLLGACFFAVIVGVFFSAAGTLVVALGEILKANLDCAVNSSPFLTDELRAEAMSIPR